MLFKKQVLFLSIIIMVFVFTLAAAEIHSAAKSGDLEVVKQLLEKDPMLINVGNKLEQSPLLMASFGGHREIVEYLLEKGAVLEQPDAFGATPLHMAVLGGKPEIVQLLIEKGANINAKSKNGKIPLQMAFENENTEIVSIFLKHGASLNSGVNPFGRTLLHEAVIMGKSKVVNFLINQGSQLDAKDSMGNTPLELALICDNKPLAQLLLDKGAKSIDIPPLEVTYIANAGFLISSQKHKLMVDTLYQSGYQKYLTPSKETINNIMNATPPFDNINLYLVTFKQIAHFDPILVDSFLEKNPETILLSTQQVSLDLELYGSNFQKIKDQIIGIGVSPPMKSIATLTIYGMKMKILRLNFASEFQALGYIINFDGKTLCFLGDSLIKNNTNYIKQLHLKNEKIDVLFITYWDFLNEETRILIDQEIQPKHIAVMHIPENEETKISEDIEKLKNKYPNVVVFVKPFQKANF